MRNKIEFYYHAYKSRINHNLREKSSKGRGMHFCEIKREIGEMKKKCLSREFNRAFSPRPRFFRRWKERIIRNVGRGNGGLYPCPRHRGGIGYCFGPLFPKQTASTLFRQKILCSARQAGRTGNGLLSVLLFVINTGSLSLVVVSGAARP